MTQNENIKELLLHSADMCHYGIKAILWGSMLFVFGGMAFFIWLASGEASVFVLLCVFLPFLLFYCARIVTILRRKNEYFLTEVVLDKPCPGPDKTMCFSVEFEDKEGKLVKAETRYVFFAYWGKPNFSDYHNRRVLIAYHAPSGDVVVLKLLDAKTSHEKNIF